MIRNQRLAMEVARLQEQNRLLRSRLHSLAVGSLKIGKMTNDRDTQTEPSQTDTMEDDFPVAKVDDHTITDIDRKPTPAVSPEQIQTRSGGDVRISLSPRRRRSHRRQDSISNLDFNLVEESSEFVKVDITEDDHESISVTTPRRRTSLRRSRALQKDPGTHTTTLLSPSQRRVSDKLADKVLSPYEVDADFFSVLSPARLEVNYDPSAVSSPHARTPRSVKKPISYQEPSLRAKVRKGFKFFKFV